MTSRRLKVSAPSSAAFLDSTRLPTTSPYVHKTLNKLPRYSLLELVLEWLRRPNRSKCPPYLESERRPEHDTDWLVPAARSLEELRQGYEELQSQKGLRKDVVEKILSGDWRDGITLYQLATVDIRYLYEHPTSHRWTAFKLSASRPSHDGERAVPVNSLPRFHAPTFLQNLQQEISSLVKAHCFISHMREMPLVVLRIHMMESPYSGTSSLMDASDGAGNGFKTLYVVFPDGAPYIYVSFAAPFRVTAGIEGRSLREIVIQALPKALSRPDFRYVMRSTALRAKSLRTMVNLRGMGRGNSAAGGWSIFAEGSFEDSPLDHISSQSGKRKIDIDPDDDKENVSMEDPWRKRRKRIAQGRFGLTGKVGDGRAIESLFVRFQDPYHIRFRSDGSEPEQAVLADETLGTSKPTERRRGRPSQISLLDDSQLSESDGHQSASNLWKPDITIHFQGTDVFAGIRKLVERDVIRGGDMPGWMTGEAGVSIGVVKDGRIASRPGVDV